MTTPALTLPGGHALYYRPHMQTRPILKDTFLHHLRDTGEVEHVLLANFVASFVHAYQQNAYHADRAWRMTTSELVKAHANWLDAVQGVLTLPHELLAPLDAVRHRDR